MPGMNPMPARRRFVNDLRDPRCIPAVDAPEIVALEAERVRLVAALEEAESGGGHFDQASYIKERAKAIRQGTELPPEPPTPAERRSANEQSRRDVAAASRALLDFADVVCQTVAAHPEWLEEARATVAAAEGEADAARAEARAAERRAEEAGARVQHLWFVAHDELYPATYIRPELNDQPDLIWNLDDPYVRELMERSRTASAL